jgi:hypothetical protein
MLVKQASADCPDTDQLREEVFLDEKEVTGNPSDSDEGKEIWGFIGEYQRIEEFELELVVEGTRVLPKSGGEATAAPHGRCHRPTCRDMRRPPRSRLLELRITSSAARRWAGPIA